MFKWKINLIAVLIVSLLFYLLSYPLNDWLSLTMPRHQLLQLPAMFLLGIILNACCPNFEVKNISYGIAGLIFIMASLIFWMLPRSVDESVIHPNFNRTMHFNMLVAGFLTIAILRNTIFEIKIVFLGMVSAMLLATGVALRVFDMLLCSSFTIDQQKETGLYFILIAVGSFTGTLLVLFKSLNHK
ncbi:MAG: hypothetical protein JST47_15140 [Bacteroidetes bacterium]|nr:hypothetical protein [Bacteroidota bacterium]MBS1973651.1 hypothetical protein [Bacteroidota bacterium]